MRYPLLDQASFRHILGLSEVISAWSWPTAQSVSQVEDSIRDRIAALEGEITKLEADALRYAASAEEFARLTRDLKVAEATKSPERTSQKPIPSRRIYPGQFKNH